MQKYFSVVRAKYGHITIQLTSLHNIFPYWSLGSSITFTFYAILKSCLESAYLIETLPRTSSCIAYLLYSFHYMTS